MNSLGPLNVTGLIAKRDLPKQFEVPPDLKESFQKQLLEQDFAVGRQITCGVLQVNPNIGEKVAYNLKMLFEELGAMAADNAPVRDSGDKSEASDDDDEEEAAEEVFDDSDLKEIFDELRGASPLLSVSDLKDWGDVQDMIESQIIDLGDLEGAIQEVTGKPKGKAQTLTFEQFVEIVDILQDAMEGMTTDLDEFGDDDDEDDDDVVSPPAPVIVKPAVKLAAAAAPPAVKLAAAAAPPTERTKMVLELESEADSADDDDTMKEVAMELFDELRGDSAKLTVTAFKSWSDIAELVDNGLITLKDLDKMVTDVVGTNKNINFDQFFTLVSSLDEMAEGDLDDNDMEEALGDDNDARRPSAEERRAVAQDGFNQMKKANGKVLVKDLKVSAVVEEMLEDGVVTEDQLNEVILAVAGSKKDLDFEEFYKIAAKLDRTAEAGNLYLQDADGDEDATEDDEELDEEDLKEVAKELFDELRGKDKKVSVAAFMAWKDVSDMIEDEVVSKEEIMEIVSEAADGKKQLDFEQFYEVVTQLDEIAGDADEMDDETMKEVAKELFDKLRGNNAKLPVADFKAWEDVKELIADGVMSKEDLNEMLEGKKQLDFDQFFELINEMDNMNGEDDEELIDDEDVWRMKMRLDESDDDDDEELDEEDMKEVAKELFDQLRGKDKMVSVAAFMAWEDLKDMIEEEVVTKEQIKDILSMASDGKKQLDFEQFYSVVTKLDEIAEDSIEEGDEGDDELDEEELQEYAMELFDELRGKDKKVSVAAIMAWDDVKEMIKEKVMSKEEIMEIVSEAAGGKKQLDFEQFYEVVTQLEDFAAGSDEGADDLEVTPTTKGFGSKNTEDVEDDESFEDMNDEEVDEMLQEVFEELKGKSKALSMKAFKKWEDIVEMIDSGIIDEKTVDSLASKVGCEKGKDLSYPQFKALVELLDEVAGEDEDDSEEMSPRDSEREGDAEDRIELDEDEISGDGSEDEEEMTPEEVEEMTRDLFDTLRGPKKSLSVATFLSWDNIKDEEALDDETINILLEEVGANRNRKGDLSYKQFSDLINLLDETVTALGDGQGQNQDIIMDDDDEESADSVSATLEEREAIDGEIELERNERNVLDGIDDEGVDEIANEIYKDLKGKVRIPLSPQFQLYYLTFLLSYLRMSY